MTFKVDQNIGIGSGGGREIHGDIYRPLEGRGNGVGVLMIHGGGWRRGSKDEDLILKIPT